MKLALSYRSHGPPYSLTISSYDITIRWRSKRWLHSKKQKPVVSQCISYEITVAEVPLTVAIGTPASIVVVKITGICSSMSQSTRGTITFGARFGSFNSSSGLVIDGIGLRFRKRSGSMNGCESTPRRSGMISSLLAVMSLPAGLVAMTR